MSLGRVLVVDDTQRDADGIARLLRQRGYTVEVQVDGGLATIASTTCDVVVLDYLLGGGTAADVLVHLRARGAPPPVVIILSGYNLDVVREACAAFGETVIAYVSKDDLGALPEVVARAMRLRSSADELAILRARAVGAAARANESGNVAVAAARAVEMLARRAR